jgi:hypothetical protein
LLMFHNWLTKSRMKLELKVWGVNGEVWTLLGYPVCRVWFESAV